MAARLSFSGIAGGAVDEGRKRVLLIAVAILAARRLAHWDGRPSPASECAISDAVSLGERILRKIDGTWLWQES
ncbi:MAG: hypothetical protein ACRD4S_07815 [Candidatus Acidiferrales bacterium]